MRQRKDTVKGHLQWDLIARTHRSGALTASMEGGAAEVGSRAGLETVQRSLLLEGEAALAPGGTMGTDIEVYKK